MRFLLAATFAVALSSSQAAAQGISLDLGETVTVRIEDGQAVIEQTTRAAPMTKFEAYVLWRAEITDVPPDARVVPPGFIVQGEGPPSPPKPDGNVLKLTMRRVPGLRPGSPDNTALFVSNGYGSTLRYRAVMQANGRTAATDVCDVAANRLGLEHWPYVIDRLDISALQLMPATEAIQCG